MRSKQVPQDDSQTYGGHKKLLYAVGENGHYQEAQSSGWQVESYATQMAVDDMQLQTEEMARRVRKGEVAPLAYYMLKRRLDIPTMAQMTGFFQWQVKRHMKPAVFKKLTDKKLQRYCQIMAISIESIRRLDE